MGNATSTLLPATERLLIELGHRLKLARLRRGLEAKQVAERAGMAAYTLRKVEQGNPNATIAAYLVVMQVLGVEGDLKELLRHDSAGHYLQDSKLIQGKGARRGPAAIVGASTRKQKSSRTIGDSDSPPRTGTAANKAAAEPAVTDSPKHLSAAARLARQTFKDENQ